MKKIKMYSNKAFAENFKLLMFIKKLTLKDIAEKTSLPISTISTWRRGRIPRSKESLNKLVKIFGVSQKDMLALPTQKNEIFSNCKSHNAENENIVNRINEHISAIASKRNAHKKLEKILETLEKNFPIKNR